MSITTKKGDLGETSLMYNKKVPKNHPQVEAYGMVDELSCSLGLIRCAIHNTALEGTETSSKILTIQKQLILLMGELATEPSDLAKYAMDGFEILEESHIRLLDQWIAVLEKKKFTGWAIPGSCELSARIEMARAICRRAERAVYNYSQTLFSRSESNINEAPSFNIHLVKYLNRLSDALWLLARNAED